MSWYYYAPRPTAAERKAQASEKIKTLRARGIPVDPVENLPHPRQIATSFWGRAWCQHLESFSDYENRLPRGRSYVRQGSVLHLAIDPGSVTALVQGSELYEISIRIEPLPPQKWEAIQSRCRGKIASLIELLQGKISGEIMAVVTDRQEGLFPDPREIKLSCSCPDWATLCKHIAAVLYGVGARLDARPELLFRLRGVDHADLIASASASAAVPGPSPSGARRRTLAPSALGDIFGIDLGDEPQLPAPDTPPAAKETARPPVRTAKPKRTAEPAPAKARKTAKNRRDDPAPPFRPTAAAVRAIRRRLGLSNVAFAALLGVSPQTSARWQSGNGRLHIHGASLEKLLALHREASAAE